MFDVWGVLKTGSVMDNTDCSGAILHMYKSEGDSEVSISVVVCSDYRAARYNGNEQVRITDDIVTCDANKTAYDAMNQKLGDFIKNKLGYEWGWVDPESISDVATYGVTIEYSI